MLFETSGNRGAAVSGRAAPPNKQPLQRKTGNVYTAPQPARKPAVAPAAAKVHARTVTGWPSQQKGQKPAGYKANSLTKPVTASAPPSSGAAFKKADPVAAPAGEKGRPNTANHKAAFRHQPPFAFGSSPARKPMPRRFFRPGNYPANAVRYHNAGPSPVPDIPPVSTPGNTPERAYPASPAAPSPPCQQCGSAGAGCSVLSGFATGSDRLTPLHYQQLAAIASTILQQNVTVVSTTGHTDAIGSDENNIVLGRMRSRNATNALRKALNEIKPGAQDGIFWRIDTKGEAEPASDTDPALNRRVEVCLQQQFC